MTLSKEETEAVSTSVTIRVPMTMYIEAIKLKHRPELEDMKKSQYFLLLIKKGMTALGNGE